MYTNFKHLMTNTLVSVYWYRFNVNILTFVVLASHFIDTRISQFKYLLMPISLMAEAGGPMNITPSFPHSSANSTFSDRNPYPG